MSEHPSAEWLAQSPLFGGLRSESREYLAGCMSPVQIEAGGVVYAEGESGQSIFVIASGNLEMVKGGAESKQVLAELKVGDFFGEMCFIDMQCRASTVRAVQDSQLWQLPFGALRGMYEVDIKTYTLMVMNMAREISRRLRSADRRRSALRAASGDAERVQAQRGATLAVISRLGLNKTRVPARAAAQAGGPDVALVVSED